MTQVEKDTLREKIIDLIKKSEEDIKDMEDMAQPITPENAIGRISRMDAINNKSVMDAALRNKKNKLTKLRMSLNNIDKEDFGICTTCKNPIQQGRLIFLPESTECVRCASR